MQPNNPYFYELRGQALLEGGKPAEAIAPLRKAVQLSNNAPLIEMLLGQALVASDNKAYTDEAIAILRAAVARETEAPIGYTQLAMAYGRKGDYAQADLASAQAAYLRGDNKTARDLASRAKTRFAIGTPGWVKADDIVSAKPLPGPEKQLALVLEINRVRLQPKTEYQTYSKSRPSQELPGTRRKRICRCLRSVFLLPPCSRSPFAARRCRLPRRASPTPSAATSRAIVRNYLIAHPEVLEEAMAELTKRQSAAEAAKHEAGVANNAEAIFNSPRGVTLGNKDGDVTFVEFFDYNCGYCKRAMTDMMELMKADPKLKVVLKEFPVLERRLGRSRPGRGRGADAGSDRQEISRLPPETARRPRCRPTRRARWPSPRKSASTWASSKRIWRAPKCATRSRRTFKLAEAMGMNGTPSYVIGKQVVIGAVGVDNLKEKIGIARCGKATC